MTTNIRQEFLNYFKKQGHTLVPSDSLVPSSDPTLLFTSAGMVQFKPHFLQQIPLTFTRAASSQRCLRTTDIEQVGRTPRHLTMFEMLGNFSFGDYFKAEAILWAWEFLTKNLSLPEKRLWVTIYKDDDEAFAIWKKIVPEKRIVRMGDETNFWTMGPTGPCGPCSEIHWDFVGDENTKGPDDSNRWMEVWNLVFTQYDRQENGDLKPLPKKNIDTGMGLERLTSVAEGVTSNFETSLFIPIIKFEEDLLEAKMGKDARKDTALKIVADHLRAVTLLVYDGILPSNEGRGYVLRRLLRRAVRQGSLFGIKDPFLFKGVSLVADLFKETANDLPGRRESIALIIKQEEERFLETLETGSAKLSEVISAAKKNKKKIITGQDAFKLYDTFGFPPELTAEILSEHSMSFSSIEFETAKNDAQRLAREGWKGSGAKDVTVYNELFKKVGKSLFIGYDTREIKAPALAILKGGASTDELNAGDEVEIILHETPFYPEGGGQVGDRGWIKSEKGDILAEIADTQKPVPDLIIHKAKIIKPFKKGETLLWTVDPAYREPTMRHHTATHLLHAALRKVLGKTVTQAGSLVSPDRLRFDYSYNQPLTPAQLKAVEDLVNEAVLKNLKVTPKITTPDEARKIGAMALFGEKYGSQVRCLIISGKGFEVPGEAFSLELCGGTHVSQTGDIGAVKIVGDFSLAAGVRRMEAIAGLKTLDYLRNLELTLHTMADSLKSSPAEIPAKITKLLERQKQLENELRDVKLKYAQGGGGTQSSAGDIQTVNGINLAVKISEGLEVKDLRTLADRLKNQIKSGIVFAATVLDDEGKDKVSFVVALTSDVQAKGVNAGAIAKTLAAVLGGSGGGRPDFAQGGGQGKEKLAEAVKKLPTLINL